MTQQTLKLGNFDSTTPAAPAGHTNVTWQVDSTGKVSAYVPSIPSGSAPLGVFRGMIFNGSADADRSHNNAIGFNPEQIGGTFAVFNSIAPGGVDPSSYSIDCGTGSAYIHDAVNVIDTGIFIQFEAWCQVASTGAARIWIGMTSTAADPNTSAPFVPIIAFRYDSATDTNWQCYVGTAALTFTKVDSGVAVSSAHFHKFKITPDGSGGINFYIDGSLVANIASGATGLPANTDIMSPILHIDNSNSGNNHKLLFNYFGWWA